MDTFLRRIPAFPPETAPTAPASVIGEFACDARVHENSEAEGGRNPSKKRKRGRSKKPEEKDPWWLFEVRPDEISPLKPGLYCRSCHDNKIHCGSGKFWSENPVALSNKRQAVARHSAKTSPHSLFLESLTLKPMDETLSEMRSDEMQLFVKLFKTVYHMAKNNEPCEKFAELRDLLEDVDAFGEAVQYLKKKNASYDSTTFYSEALNAIASVLWEERQELISGKKIAVICDEVKDSSNKQQLLIFYRTSDRKGEVLVIFAGAIDLHLGAGSDVLTAAILHQLAEDNISVKDVVCITTDGASPMLGKDHGLSRRLLEMNKICVAVHCSCHRQSLACKGSTEAIPYLNHWFDTLGILYRFFYFSPKRQAIFEDHQDADGTGRCHLQNNAVTRWLSHDGVSRFIRKSFPALHHTLKELAGPKDLTAEGLLKFVGTNEFVFTSCMPVIFCRRWWPSTVRFSRRTLILLLLSKCLKQFIVQSLK
jgi:hypothetical protein